MVTINYNSQRNEVADGKVATYQCNGQIMKSDITIEGNSFSVLTCNGLETQIPDGKRAVIPCHGKIMRSDLSVNTKYCKIVVYAEDDATVVGEFLAMPNVTVKVISADTDGVVLQFAFNGSNTADRTQTYCYSTKLMEGVTDDPRYYRCRYSVGDSFVLVGHRVHNLYIRPSKLGYTRCIWLFGLGYIDGVDYLLRTPGETTWTEWVNDPQCNKIGAQIIGYNIYTGDGSKVLYNADDILVDSRGMPINHAEYTFVEVGE